MIVGEGVIQKMPRTARISEVMRDNPRLQGRTSGVLEREVTMRLVVSKD